MSTPTIVTANSEKAIKLQNGLFTRPIALPAGWLRARVGIRCSVDYNAGGFSGTPKFALGFSASGTAAAGDASPASFNGLYTFETATWAAGDTMGGGVAIKGCNVEGARSPYYQQGGDTTFGIGSQNGYQSQIFADFEWNQAYWGYVYGFWKSATGMTSANFLANMQVPTPAGFTAMARGCPNYNYPYTSYNWINLYWSDPTNALYVYDLAVSLIS